MSFGGFGKDSGPLGTGPRTPSAVQIPWGSSSSPPRTVSPGNEHTLNWRPGNAPQFKENDSRTYQRPPDLLSLVTSNNSRNGTPTEVQNSRRTSSPYSRSPNVMSNNSVGGIVRAHGSHVHQKMYASDQHPRTQGIQQRPNISPVWGGELRPTTYNTSLSPQEQLSPILTTEGTHKSGPMFKSMRADVPLSKQKKSPIPPSTTRSTVSPESTVFRPPGHKRSLIDYRDLDAPEAMPSPSMAVETSFYSGDATHPFAGSEKPFTSSFPWGGQSNSSGNNTVPVVQETSPSFMTARVTYQSGNTLTKNANSPLPKRARSPKPPSASEAFSENPAIYLEGNQRPLDFQHHSQSLMSGPTSRVEVAVDKSMQFPSVKRIKTPPPPPSSTNLVFQENLNPAQESERELLAKEKRLARFKDELSLPVQSNSMVRNQGIPTKRLHQYVHEKQSFSEDPTVDVMGDSGSGNFVSDNEGRASSSSVIVGLCPDMCPESERGERERKGDLDQYERVDGDRNLSSEFLAVKKYTRTAEREAKLIRPMPILQKTMEYLLNLLSEPYDDRFLGLYNFLWDRMRAIRMDLRMQHIFNLEAISMLEQMIRLHIIAMHELCEYTKGEGFAEGFDAHLNIEQMNKTSVELFQLYDDHRKKGIHVPSEREFRGYYALLKLDKHPGYKVEPAELSLDLSKMTPEIRQTPEVLFARDVARACRLGNFISFFRLANKASYLQGCLMHAHFSKLRTQALASLHSGLQINQGIPIAHVAKWLGMEEEDMDELLEYHGFSVKEFKEPYMMKENAFINADTDFPIKRSKLVERKRSVKIASDVAFSSPTQSYTVEEVPQIWVNKSPEPALTRIVSSFAPIGTGKPHDEEMHDLVTISSPEANMQQSKSKVSIDIVSPEEKMVEYDIRLAPPMSPYVLDFSPGSADNNQKRVDSPQKPKFDSVFRNSFGRSNTQESEIIPPITLDTDKEIRHPVSPRDSVAHTPIPQSMFIETLEDEQIHSTEEDESDDLTLSYYDQEVWEAKLKLILRLWKRRTAKKKELREHKQLAASAAMSVLSMGPPMWQHENPSTNYGMLDIDHVMSERYEIQERSSLVLNPSHVVAAKLAEKNPHAKCLCWKIIVCSLPEIPGRDYIQLQNEVTRSWFQSKLMPANCPGNGDLVTSSPSLAIWRSWSPSLSGDDLTCCLSVIRSTVLNDLNEAVTGTSAIIFILSDYAPIEPQKRQLHDLVASLHSGSHLPLLILDGSGKDESDASTIVQSLGLLDIDRSRVIAYKIHFLKDTERKKLGGFLSDKLLREGLEWLASESPSQIVLHEIKTHELVRSYLNPTLEVLDETTTHTVGPNSCISAFNEALDRSMKAIAAAVDANPTGWPCPEIEQLNQSSDEYRAIARYLPSIRWSSASRTEVLMHALQNAVLPPFQDDLSWLSRGFSIKDNTNSQTSCLENCLLNYLTVTSRMMGEALAEREARITLQKSTRLELHDTAYYIIPQWVSIFRRIYNWRLLNLTHGEVFSAYVLQQEYTLSVTDSMDSRAVAFSPPYLVNPSLDELLDVGCRSQVFESNHLEHEGLSVWLPVTSCYTDAPATNNSFAFVDEENNDGVVQATDATQDAKQADRLSELLEKCKIMQNLIDKKLSIYF